MIEPIHYGLVKNDITPEHWVMGASALPKVILQSNRNWGPYLPVAERQNINFETAGCAVFGTYNCLETICKKLYGTEKNWADRFTYIMANVAPPGSDVHFIAETLRKNGTVQEDLLPMTETYAEYIIPKPMTRLLLDEGDKFLDTYDFNHEWVFHNNPKKEDRIALIREALQYSPLGITVSAWSLDNGVYVDRGQPNNHYVECFALYEEAGEVYPMVYDTYPPYIKKLHPDHHIEICKRYSLTPSTRTQRVSIIKQMIKLLFELLLRAKENGGRIGRRIVGLFR